MKVKLFSLLLAAGFINSCYSTEFSQKPIGENAFKNLQRELPNKGQKPKGEVEHPNSEVIKGSQLSPIEEEAIDDAQKRKISSQDIKKGLAAYREEVATNPKYEGVPFEIYNHGDISINNYL